MNFVVAAGVDCGFRDENAALNAGGYNPMPDWDTTRY